ncbi:hypothetical protein [Maricaulis sp.]|uniref:hypothetical protein n=1 Tax=Maricaulis sp. TaxID=1486257 RepID=UPI003A8F8478
MFVAALLAVTLQTSEAGQGQPRLECSRGPIEQGYGGNSWLVYGCSDDKSIVFVSTPSSPANPFYFFLAFVDGTYRLRGEGTGDERATSAAYEELRELTATDISSILSAIGEVSNPSAVATPN